MLRNTLICVLLLALAWGGRLKPECCGCDINRAKSRVRVLQSIFEERTSSQNQETFDLAGYLVADGAKGIYTKGNVSQCSVTVEPLFEMYAQYFNTNMSIFYGPVQNVTEHLNGTVIIENYTLTVLNSTTMAYRMRFFWDLEGVNCSWKLSLIDAYDVACDTV